MRPNQDVVTGWQAIPSNPRWGTIDEATNPSGTLQSTDHVKTTAANQTYSAGMTTVALGGNPQSLVPWFYASTGPSTRLRVQVWWNGALRAEETLGYGSAYAWRTFSVPTPAGQSAIDDVSFAFTSLDGPDARVGAALFKLSADAGGATVTGADQVQGPLTITPSGNYTQDQINIASCCQDPVLIIQRMPVTKLVNRITVGDFAPGPSCPNPAYLRLRVDEAKSGELEDLGVGLTSSSVPVGAGPPGQITFEFIPFTMKEGRAYMLRLGSQYTNCTTATRRTWEHKDELLDFGPSRCDRVSEQTLTYWRMWHVQGQNDAVPCWGNDSQKQIPANFSADMPTGWLVLYRPSSTVLVLTTTTKCSGQPENGTLIDPWRFNSQGQFEFVCKWYEEFAPYSDEDPPTPDGWYRAPWFSSFNGQRRDAKFSAWLDQPSLAAHYKPYLRFDEEEQWRPLSLDYLFSDPGTYGDPPHLRCPTGLGGTCIPITSVDELSLSDTTAARLDLHSEGENPVEDYRTPGESNCTTSEVWDCNSGDRSLLYWTIDFDPADPQGYQFVQYWAFYRYNGSPGDPFVEYDHEGDWEAVAVAPSQQNQEFGAFDLASFSQHGSWYSYLRENLECYSSSSTSCGTEQTRYNRQPVAYVADGTHANYPDACQQSVTPLPFPLPPLYDYCEQANGITPEGDHNGDAPWGNNGRNANGLAPIPNVYAASWPLWNGLWGATADPESPKSPANQSQYFQSWELCADDNDGCLDPIGQSAAARGAADPSSRVEGPPMINGPRLRSCNDWFGAGVSFVICERRRLTRAAQRSVLGKAGAVRAGTGSRVAVNSRTGRTRHGGSFDSAPGIAQAVGAPLRKGDVIALRVSAKRTAQIQVRVLHRGQVVALRWKGVPLHRKTRLRVVARGRAIFLKDLRTARRVEPVAIEAPFATG